MTSKRIYIICVIIITFSISYMCLTANKDLGIAVGLKVEHMRFMYERSMDNFAVLQKAVNENSQTIYKNAKKIDRLRGGGCLNYKRKDFLK